MSPLPRLPRVRMGLLVSIVTLAAGTACQAEGDHQMDVTFDPCQPLVLVPASDSSADERASIADAAAMWQQVGVTQAGLTEVEGARRLPVRFATAAAAFHGVYLDESGELVVNRALTDRRQRAITIAHELGHAYGLWHVELQTRKSVMNKGNLDTVPLSGDAAALSAYWGACPPAAAPAP